MQAHVRHRAGALAAILLLSGCASVDEAGSGIRSGFGDVGSSLGGAFGRSSDTYGTNRRVDVYGASTAPSLPTIGAPGFGK